MCGIAGMLRQDGTAPSESLICAMTRVLSHRGPDGEGFYRDGPVALGHRRLAIIDLVTGSQPMGSEDGALWLSYNGEIYNFRELRQELMARGHRFRTTSDTEVILRGYEAWGVDVLPRLRGMFAFALWDGRRGELLLARDRLGIKPLVYAWDGRCLRFASEIKAILQDPEVPRSLDWAALCDYFVHLYIPAPRTIFSAIRKLPPASYLVCRAAGGSPEIRRYWTLRPAFEETRTEDEWVERLDQLLEETIRLHMVSDVPLGAFLSGGLDSSTVVAYMTRASSQPIKTFSIGFDEADYDELRYARLVARRYGTEHVELVVKPDVVALLPRLAWQLDEPFADASAIPTYCVARLTREHVTVALSGDGGDENFAGYRRYLEAAHLARLADRPPLTLLRPLLRSLAGLWPPGLRGGGYLRLLGTPPVERYFRLMSYQREDTLARLLAPEVTAHVDPRPDPGQYLRLARECTFGDALTRLRYVDVHHYLPDDILTKVDRTSMLVSLESRVPLLDHVLVEFVAAIPERLKLRRGETKYILKRSVTPLLPSQVLSRPKMGFGVPLATWFRGPLRELVCDLLLSARLRQRGIVQAREVKALLEAHMRGRRDCSSQLWSLLCFELWARTWLDR